MKGAVAATGAGAVAAAGTGAGAGAAAGAGGISTMLGGPLGGSLLSEKVTSSSGNSRLKSEIPEPVGDGSSVPESI